MHVEEQSEQTEGLQLFLSNEYDDLTKFKRKVQQEIKSTCQPN